MRTALRGFVLLAFVFIRSVWALELGAARVVGQSPRSIELELKVVGMTLVPRIIDGKKYLKLRAKGFLFQSPEGFPELPHLTSLVKIPDGYDVKIAKIRRSGLKLLRLKNEIAFEPTPLIHANDTRNVKRDLKAYQQRFGELPVEVTEVSYAESERFAVLQWSPFDYDAPKRRLRWSKRVRVTLDLIPTEHREVSPVTSVEGREVASAIALNGPKPLRRALRPQYVDLVIAHEDHQEALLRYLWFKRVRGHEVREYYVKNSTADAIKEIIKKEYASAVPPSSTLLVGNISQIPSWSGSGDCRYTDFPYQNLDAGNLPDVSLGRVPAHNKEELDAFIAKSLFRETEPRNDDAILLTSGRDTGMGCPANVSAVGEEFKSAGAKVNLIKRLRTEVGTAEVINGYNDSPNIVVYDGHGNESGMLEIPLTSSGLNVLKNKNFPIALDIACLNASWSGGANARNFAERILLQPGAGVVGIMASGGSGYGHDFFRTIGNLLGAAQKNLTEDTTLNAIGRIIMLAKAKHGTQDKTYWNYYGDPASQIWQLSN